MEVPEITQRVYVLNFCLSIMVFNKAKIKQQTNPTSPKKTNQTPKHYSKSMVLFYPNPL